MSSPRILVGPNILASRDGDFAHVEMMVAANPRRASDLLATSIVFAQPDGSVAIRPYVSFDGGFRWDETAQPSIRQLSGADPQVAYGLSGTPYFMLLGFSAPTTPPELQLFRSSDGGRSWENPVVLGNTYDHPQIAVDYSYGRFAGRVYVGVLGGGMQYDVGVFRSDDDGRSFIGPVIAATGGGKIGINVVDLLVLSDGTLIVPYCDFDTSQTQQHGTKSEGNWSVISEDGGLSFSKPRFIGKRTISIDPPYLDNFPRFAADSTKGQYKDRLYAMWSDFQNGRSKLVFSYSTDRGSTWSRPTPIDTAAPESALQFQPAMAVNKDGILGVIWDDTRGLSDDDYNEYFAASLDGGKSFLPSVKLSDKVSHRMGAGNLRVSPMTWKMPKEPSSRMVFLSPATRWGGGGDYVGLTADIDGTFHPLWPDSRSGTFQIYTAQVKVESTSDPPAPSECPLARKDVSEDVLLLNDPPQFLPEKREANLPMRIKNNLKQAMYPPITVEVDGFGSGMGEMRKEYAPTILDASNGKSGIGAVFDFSTYLGDFNRLEPGAESGAFTWRLQLPSVERVPDLHYRVFAQTPTCKGSVQADK